MSFRFCVAALCGIVCLPAPASAQTVVTVRKDRISVVAHALDAITRAGFSVDRVRHEQGATEIRGSKEESELRDDYSCYRGSCGAQLNLNVSIVDLRDSTSLFTAWYTWQQRASDAERAISDRGRATVLATKIGALLSQVVTNLCQSFGAPAEVCVRP